MNYISLDLTKEINDDNYPALKDDMGVPCLCK